METINEKIQYQSEQKGSSVVLEAARETLALLQGEDVCRGPAARVQTFVEHLQDQQMTVAVIGQFKRGKSALSNRILGGDILPVGIVPITSAVTRVVYGDPGAQVRFLDGEVRPVENAELSTYISEQENKGNRLRVEEVKIQSPAAFLEGGITFLDTPGVGSFHKNNTEVAYRYMKESDAVIFLLSVDSPINQIEIDFLAGTQEFAGKFYFAVNKIDLAASEDLEIYLAYCRDVLVELTGQETLRLFPVSAKTGDGVEELKAAVRADLAQNGKAILEESVRKKLMDAIDEGIRQLHFCWKAVNLSYQELDEKFQAMDAFCKQVRQDAAETSGTYELVLNRMREKTSDQVKELFGMEYTYPVTEQPAGTSFMTQETFLQEVESTLTEIQAVLSSAILYREENAYAVVRRASALNRLERKLRKIREMLASRA